MAIEPKPREFENAPSGSLRIDVDGLILRHGKQLLGIARRHSANAADADDAYQRALEILLTKAPCTDEDRIVAWLQTVVRNEALQINRSKKNLVDTAFDEISESWIADAPLPDELLVENEQLGQGREALSRINPDQARCLLLRADGLGYPDICRITGFSYAKVNRCLSEGRKAIRTHVGMLASGAECKRLFPALSMLVDSEIMPEMRADVELHLETCLSCQASVRELRSTPGSLASVLPLGFVVAAQQRRAFGSLVEAFQGVVDNLLSRLAGHAGNVAASQEIAFAKKAAIVVAISTSLVAGGTVVEQLSHDGKRGSGNATAVSGAAGDTASQANARIRNEKSARARNRRRAVRMKRREATAADVAQSVAASPQSGQADPLSATTADDAQTPAADPTDAPVAGGASGGSDRAGLAP